VALREAVAPKEELAVRLAFDVLLERFEHITAGRTYDEPLPHAVGTVEAMVVLSLQRQGPMLHRPEKAGFDQP
jgi:hypothetical protein